MRETNSLVTSFGALAPGMSTAPTTRSASSTAFSSSKALEVMVRTEVPKMRSASRSLFDVLVEQGHVEAHADGDLWWRSSRRRRRR